mmetsp:Transcript_33249/g.73536  ORF Transcript_33249/g.73536 Transcript_33249/m.73536 type:complete len:330 (+) Transcript_33249:279-1268(+)
MLPYLDGCLRTDIPALCSPVNAAAPVGIVHCAMALAAPAVVVVVPLPGLQARRTVREEELAIEVFPRVLAPAVVAHVTPLTSPALGALTLVLAAALGSSGGAKAAGEEARSTVWWIVGARGVGILWAAVPPARHTSTDGAAVQQVLELAVHLAQLVLRLLGPELGVKGVEELHHLSKLELNQARGVLHLVEPSREVDAVTATAGGLHTRRHHVEVGVVVLLDVVGLLAVHAVESHIRLGDCVIAHSCAQLGAAVIQVLEHSRGCQDVDDVAATKLCRGQVMGANLANKAVGHVGEVPCIVDRLEKVLCAGDEGGSQGEARRADSQHRGM